MAWTRAKVAQETIVESENRTNLVIEVKNMCRADPAAKAAWCSWVDSNANGTKDPNRMNEMELARFIEEYQCGSIQVSAESQAQSMWTGGKGGGKQQMAVTPGDNSDLAEAVKLVQRSSKSCKECWARYAELQGNGTYDPGKHPREFLAAFFDFLGAHGGASLSLWAIDDGAASIPQAPPVMQQATPPQFSGVRPSASAAWGGKGAAAWAPPSAAKRPRLDLQQPVASDEQQNLAMAVQQLQKSDPEKKVMWVEYCDSQQNGTKDPRLHSVQSLQGFMVYCGLT